MPSPEEQLEIVRRVHQLLAVVDELRRRIRIADSKVTRSSQVVLVNGLRGELSIAGEDRGSA